MKINAQPHCDLITLQRDDVIDFSKKKVYDGFFSLYEYRFKHKKFDGSMSDEVVREIMERPNAVIVLAYDPILDSVVLVEQIRIGSVEESATPWMLELIAGMMDKENESWRDVAEREAAEEAGITLTHCRKILSYFASPGGQTEKLHIVLAKVDARTAKGVHGVLSEEEDIKVHVVSRTQAYEWVENGMIDNAGAIIGLQWLQMHYESIQKEWALTK